MGTVETLATIIVTIAVIKLIVWALNPKGLLDFSAKLMKNAGQFQAVLVVAGAIILYYLTKAGIGIIEIMAVLLFASTVYGVALVPYMSSMVKDMRKGHVFERNWLTIVIWLALLIWAIVALFF